MKKWVSFSLAFFLALVILLGACAAPAPVPTKPTTPAAPATPPAPAAPIKIGAPLALTGPSATTNAGMKFMMMQAVKDVNAAGGVLGRQIELVMYDDQLKSDLTTTMCKKLINDAGVVGIVGAMASPTGLAAGQVCQEFQIPLIGMGMTDTSSKPILPYAFQYFCPNFYAIRAMLTRAKGLGNTKIGYYYTDTAWGTGGLDTLKRLLTLPDFKDLKLVDQQGTPLGTTEVTVQVTKLKNSDAQTVIVLNYDTETAAFYRSLDALGWKPHTISVIGATQSALTIVPIKLMVGAETVDWFTDTNPKAMQAADRTKASFPEWDPQNGVSYIGYDELMLIVEGIKRAGSTDPKAIRDAIEKIWDWPMPVVGMPGSVCGFSPTDHVGMTGGPVKAVTPEGKLKFIFGEPNVSALLGF